ncbi:yippee family protein [Colletotrichum tofieldiae]|uniref:Yippee family protein n=1 Tax=Colletotrichum tofieldiae TaxID=708197 RepID=A0A166S184_9PEZI|nr:Yippee family protein [Colletotrichum tofieldiae]GKT60586.1 Yippee family protein [Colletotrichum tofieldiae]GKT68289.1 yippee family protein [Colletotrichum tofieldiae]GKT90703.1 yippee family protein [Colletotrichum tofieldiae]
MAPNIVVSRPTFPTYLLPSFNIPFRRRASSASTPTSNSPSTPDASQVPSLSSSPTSSTTDETVTPPGSPPPPPSYQDAITTSAVTADNLSTTAKPARTRPSRPSLARTQPDTLRCSTCSCDVAFSSQIVSKGFTGRYGRAYLVAPTPPPSAPVSGGVAPAAKASNGPAGPGSLANVRIGKCENRQLVTGWHVVADITCTLCSAKLGWKYVDAKELSQKYKVGKFILEVERVVPFRSWEDVSADYYHVSEDGDESEEEGDEAKDDSNPEEADVDGAEGAGKKGESEAEDVEIVFDSEDEDDLEDLFSGNWDPEVVAKRRSRRVTAARKK